MRRAFTPPFKYLQAVTLSRSVRALCVQENNTSAHYPREQLASAANTKAFVGPRPIGKNAGSLDVQIDRDGFSCHS